MNHNCSFISSNSIIFVAGVYGVGKSTLCDKLSKLLNIPTYSAGDLISEINGEIYGENKAVKNKKANQDILVSAVQKKLREHSKFILAGHFCIFTADNLVDILPENVFSKLSISKILLLESDSATVLQNIRNRDHKNYSSEEISRLIEAEKRQAEKIALSQNIPLITHQMTFNDDDRCVVKKLEGGADSASFT